MFFEETLFSCDFDNCDLNQWETTDFNWTRTNRATRTPNTGPQHDHTYQGNAALSMCSYCFREELKAYDTRIEFSWWFVSYLSFTVLSPSLVMSRLKS